jgi:hypothetical protein
MIHAGTRQRIQPEKTPRSEREDAAIALARRIARSSPHKNNTAKICANARLEKTLHSQYYLKQWFAGIARRARMLSAPPGNLS